MASLSERLKRERELRGISLRQISEETRIGVRFLEALEEGRLEIIPGEFYRRSYLRAYARYLGLDEDRAVNAYDFSRKEKPSGKEEAEPEPVAVPLPPWVKWAVAAAAIALPAVLLLRAMPASTTETDPVAPESRPVDGERPPSIEGTDTPSPLPEEPSEPTEWIPVATAAAPPPPLLRIPSEAGPLRLVLSVDEACWLEIAADGEIVASGLKEAGYRQRVVAEKELRLWLGNAGGVRLLLNDELVKSLGGPGQVRKDVTITPENVREFLVPGNGRS
jgi:cytoskeletal protein RodZ